MNPNRQTQPPEPAPLSLKTRNFGTVTVQPEQIITFLPGLLGFGHYHRYVLLERPQDTPFFWLQCVDCPDLAFVVVDPRVFFPAYQPACHPEVLREVAAQDPQEVKVLVILTIPPGRPQDLTANLMGPLIINMRTRRGRQIVLDNPNFSHQQPLLGLDPRNR